MAADTDLQNAQPDTWQRETWNSLLNIANTAVGNLTEKNPTAVTQAAQAPQQSWLSKLDTKQIVMLVVVGLAVLFIGKKLMK